MSDVLVCLCANRQVYSNAVPPEHFSVGNGLLEHLERGEGMGTYDYGETGSLLHGCCML